MIEKDPLTRNYELDKATQEAIARGNEIREKGGLEYVEALIEEGELDRQGTSGERFIGSTVLPQAAEVTHKANLKPAKKPKRNLELPGKDGRQHPTHQRVYEADKRLSESERKVQAERNKRGAKIARLALRNSNRSNG